jgi:hypothetical protein
LVSCGYELPIRDVDGGQPSRIFHRQGAQPNRIEQLENGGVRADPERQRSNRDNGKPGIAPQHPSAMA